VKQVWIFILISSWMISTSSAAMQKVEVVDAVKRKAVCNDGSPAVYYFEPGSGDGVKRWLIVLGGGSYCNVPGCIGRDPFLMTSLDKPDQIESPPLGLRSVSSTQNPDFYNANHVSIPYCSSDLWSGNRFDITEGQRPLQFRGRTIFRSVIKDLMNRSGSNLKEDGTEILLAGYSAGGVGVMVNLDWLAEQLSQAKVRGLNDGGWIPEESNLSPDVENDIAQGIPLWQGVSDQDCVLANRSSKSKCYLSSAFRYIKTPIFVAQSQADDSWLQGPIVFPPKNYTAEISKAVRHSLIPVEAAFSPRKKIHMISLFDGFTTVKVNGYSLKDLLGNWFFNRAGPVKMIKE
jgi:hypothetical protein